MGERKKPATKAGKHVMNRIVNRVMISEGRKSVHLLDSLSRNAIALQRETLFSLLKECADTEYGRKYDFAGIRTVEEFKEKVPFSDYDSYEPYIRRMLQGQEKNLILPGDPVHYAKTSGSVGVPKSIPVSERELLKYRRFATNLLLGVMDEYYRNTTGHTYRSGFGLNLIEVRFSKTSGNIPTGAISGNIMSQLRRYLPYFMIPPWQVISPPAEMDLKYLHAIFALAEPNIVFIDGAFMTAAVDFMDYTCKNWRMLVHDIETGTIDPEVDIPEPYRTEFQQMMTPDPKRAKALAAEFEKGFEGIVQRIWKHIQFLGCIGTGGFMAYTRKMRWYTGRNLPYSHLTYAASEGLFAAARRTGDTSYVLIPDGGFYEFIPVKNGESTETLTIEDLEAGEEYEMIVTNLSGFFRYRMKDVIRVTGFYNESPLIQFLYRKNQIVSIAGEKTNEEALRWSVEQFSKVTGLHVDDYSIYADEESVPGHYVILMEPDHIVPKEMIPRYRDVIEAKLMQANPSYGDKIRLGTLGPTELVFVQQQTYQLYRELMVMKGRSANQLKPVRAIDTEIKKRFFFELRENYD